MIRTIRNGMIAALLIAGIFGLSGCSRNSSAAEQELPLVYEDSLRLQYAENFSIDYYAGGNPGGGGRGYCDFKAADTGYLFGGIGGDGYVLSAGWAGCHKLFRTEAGKLVY